MVVLTTISSNNDREHNGKHKYISNTGCQFAVRSGGHASFAGAANIQGGVTIDLSSLDAIELKGQGSLPVVSVGTGATWGQVYSHLDGMGLTVSGGRASSVGVGGLSIGGGISYLGPRVGWTCDTVINYEVVLADGSIVNANQHQHADLLWALRGGTNNFGIVTKVDFQTFEQGKLWGGFVVTPYSTVDKQMVALAEFNDPSTYDNYASLLTTFAYSGKQDFQVVVNNMEYTKPVVNPLVYHKLTSLPSLSNTQRITNMSDLAAETEASDAKGSR